MLSRSSDFFEEFRPTDGASARLACLVFNFNYGRFLRKAVESALAQDLREEFHVWIVDDASSDDSIGIARNLRAIYGNRLGLLRAETNLFGNRKCVFTRAMKCMNYEYLALLDADDYWTDPDKLALQVQVLDSQPSAVLVHHSFLGVHVGIDREDVMRAVPRLGGNWSWRLLSVGDGIGTSTVMIRRAAINALPSLDGLVAWDWACWSLVARTGRIVSLPQVMSAYQLHGDNLWARKTSPMMELRQCLEVETFMVKNVDVRAQRYWRLARDYRRFEIWAAKFLKLSVLRRVRRVRGLVLQATYRLLDH